MPRCKRLHFRLRLHGACAHSSSPRPRSSSIVRRRHSWSGVYSHFERGEFMKKGLASVLAMAFGLQAQSAPHMPRGTATDVTNSEIQAALKKTAASAVSDQQLSVISINGEYNVAIGILHRAKTSGKAAGGGLEHSLVTEVYQIISGNGTFMTGGTLLDPKEAAPDSAIVKVLDGPSTSGGPIQNGLSRKVGPGDMI